MTPGAEANHLDPVPEGEEATGHPLASSIESTLFNGMPIDDRYESGVPEEQRGNSLDFIQMSGLTRPAQRTSSQGGEGDLTQAPIYDDLNPSRPLSFYEKGVVDVDDSMERDGLAGSLRDAILDHDLIPGRGADALGEGGGASRSAQAFHDIAAGLLRTDVEEEQAEDDEDLRDIPSESVASGESAPEEMSTSAALLAMMEELESAMDTTANHDEGAPVGQETPEHVKPVVDGRPAAEIGDDDFDVLLASLSGWGNEGEEPALDPMADAESASLSHAPPMEPVEVENPEPVSDVEDWDALLDGKSVRESTPEEPSAPAPQKPPAHGALAEAEQLMQALGKPPQRVSPTPEAPPAPSSDELTAPITATEEVPNRPPHTSVGLLAPVFPERPDGAQSLDYDFNATPSRRRSRRHSRVARRGLKLLGVVLYITLFGGLAVALWIYIAGPMLLQDEDLTARAERLMAAREYTSASQTYQQLASRLAPGGVERANAEFRAAYALTLGPETSGDDTKRRYGTAVQLFKKFTEDYPQHPKRARALSLMGRLHFELRDFEQAITVLRDHVKPMDDPAAALAMLRYLARAYSMTGKYEEAETSYLQAATLPGNYNAEVDYLELGDLFRQRAGLEKDPVARKELESTAMSYWRRALQVPGLAPGDRSALEERLQWLSYTDENAVAPKAEVNPAPPPTIPGDAPAVDGVAASREAATPASPIPVATDETGRAEVPGAELEALAVPTPQAAQ